MRRDKFIQVTLSDIELQALKKFAASSGISMPEAVRDWVKTLIPKKKFTSRTRYAGIQRDKFIQVTLSDIELQALKKFAASSGIYMTDAVRDWVKTLIPKV